MLTFRVLYISHTLSPLLQKDKDVTEEGKNARKANLPKSLNK